MTDNLEKKNETQFWCVGIGMLFVANLMTIHRFNEWTWRPFVDMQCTICIFEFVHYLFQGIDHL